MIMPMTAAMATSMPDLQAGDSYHLVYVLRTPAKGTVQFRHETHAAEEGAGVLLAPSESARFEATTGNLDLLHMVVPKPPSAVNGDLPGGPGYFFNRKTLRALTDASGGRIRRFCAESLAETQVPTRLNDHFVRQNHIGGAITDAHDTELLAGLFHVAEVQAVRVRRPRRNVVHCAVGTLERQYARFQVARIAFESAVIHQSMSHDYPRTKGLYLIRCG